MSWVTDLWELAKKVVTLTDDLKNYHAEIKEIRKELRDLTLIVHALAQEVRHGKERAAAERERILLEVENKLLKFQRGLPPAPEDQGGK